MRLAALASGGLRGGKILIEGTTTMLKAIGTGVAAGLAMAAHAQAETTIPSDVSATCTVSESDLAGWFADGTIAQNGLVSPADSISFPATQNTACDFYKWGAQMFLWLTSPVDGAYVFDGSSFYDVVPDGSNYVFESNAGDSGNALSLRVRKADETAGAETIDEVGQAGGGDVLISQAGSLTYYGIHANDVYAEYKTGQSAGSFDGTDIASQFPTTQADLELVESYAGETFADGDALTMELKTSWVDASTVSDASRFVTIEAEVPAFDTSSVTTWTPDGTATLELALVGIHVVGTVNGHPELVWATFEHVDNAPDAPYYYVNTDNQNVLVPFDSSGDWLFMESGGSYTSHIAPTASYDSSSGDIVAASGQTIGPVDVVRLNPWGDAPSDASSASNNTDILSLNGSIIDQLSTVGDVRANYIQIGGIWSQLGQIPTSGTDDFLRGSLFLANATMETFHQYPDENNGFVSNNCFTCHSTSSGDGIDLSHIFDELEPLGTDQ